MSDSGISAVGRRRLEYELQKILTVGWGINYISHHYPLCVWTGGGVGIGDLWCGAREGVLRGVVGVVGRAWLVVYGVCAAWSDRLVGIRVWG